MRGRLFIHILTRFLLYCMTHDHKARLEFIKEGAGIYGMYIID